MVDIFCWNVRGFNNSLKRSNFKKWLRQNKPSFGSLLETHVCEHKAHKHVHSTFPGWNFVGNYEFAELGRIWIVWDNSVQVTVISKSKQMISCLVRLPQAVEEVIVSFIYAENCKYRRQVLWDEMKGLAGNVAISTKPWFLLGDFNQILNPSEDSSGCTRIKRGMADFRDCLGLSNLFDLTIRGNLFTWWNKQESTPIARKLDRILVNDHWQTLYPISYAHFGDPDFSDHCPGSVRLGSSDISRKPFKVSHFSLSHKDFLPRVLNFWNVFSVEGSAMYTLSMKLKALKSVLKDINREHFLDLENRVKDAHLALTTCQSNLLLRPSSMAASLEKKAHKDSMCLALAEEKFLMQRSRVKWLGLGDCNSSFFHKMLAARRSFNQIHYLIDSNGVRLDKSQDIKDHSVDFFKNLVGGNPLSISEAEYASISSFTPFRCGLEAKDCLLAEVTPADVKREVFALPLYKSPGPDGFTGEFFRASWSVIGHGFTKAVLEFFQSGKLLKQWNCTLISLIPKRVGADKIGEFRPISLCNAVYKIVAKVLARRLQVMLPTMISSNQSAFVKGRLLVENVLLASEMVQGFNQKHITTRGMLKVDLRKAFDSVSWDFILHIFRAAEFPAKFISWIEQCITTTTFSISINGESCGFFKGTKGLRQGDPLSPTLFVMAMETFSNLLASKYESGQIGFHPLGKNPEVTHLAFADDIMIFFDGKETSLRNIAASLESFHLLSGLEMNKDKTELFTGGTTPIQNQALSEHGFQCGIMPIRYLGLPLLHRKLRKSDYSPLTDGILKKFSHWTTKSLTFSGRLQLISSVIYSLINFWFSAFTLPKGCLKQIEKKCNKFLWAGDMEKRTSAKVSWKKICLSKGGLGLRDLIYWIKVMSLKLIWFLFSNSGSLWVAWTKKHYLKRNSFWTVEAKANSSWIWKALLSLRHQACDDQRWLVSSRTRNQRLGELSRLLQSIQLPDIQDGDDTFLWGEESNRSDFFSTKKTWDLIRPKEDKKLWFKAVWFKLHIPKHAFTFWIATMDRLPVRNRLAAWGMNVSSSCCLCSLFEETRDHLLLHCSYAEQVWTHALRRLGQPATIFVSWSTLISWLLTRSPGTSTTLKRLVVQSTIYLIWRERTVRLHDSIASTALETF